MYLDQKIETHLKREVDFNKEVILETKTILDKEERYVSDETYIAEWNILDIPQPTMEELDAITEWINPRADEDAREERDKLLKETDWTQQPDSPLTEEKKEAYKVYRQSLRDISKQVSFPNDVVWADKP